MHTHRRPPATVVAALLAVLACPCGQAAAPAAVNEIVALQVAPWTGAAGENGWNANVGIQLAFDEVNSDGGIKGRKLRLVFEQEDPADVDGQLRSLQQQWAPVALVGSVGAASMRQLLKDNVLDALSLPAVGVVSGDPSLRDSQSPYLLITRPSLVEELKAVFRQLATIGATRVVLVASPREVGDLPDSAAILARAAGIEIVANVAYTDAVAPGQAAARALATPHDAVIIASSTPRTSDFCRAYKAGGKAYAQIVSLSTAEPTRLASYGSKQVARGVMFSLVVPNPRNRNLPLVHEFLDAFTRLGPAGVSPTTGMFESYISARVLIHALEHASSPTASAVTRFLSHASSTTLAGERIYFHAQSDMNRASLVILDDEGRMVW